MNKKKIPMIWKLRSNYLVSPRNNDFIQLFKKLISKKRVHDIQTIPG